MSEQEGEGSERQGLGQTASPYAQAGGQIGRVVWKGPLAAAWGQAGRPVPGDTVHGRDVRPRRGLRVPWRELWEGGEAQGWLAVPGT